MNIEVAAMTGHQNKRRLPKPYRQGDLDGLCGVYSIINSVRVLAPEIDQEAAEWLFSELMYALSDFGAEPKEIVTGGIGRRHLSQLIRRAVRYMIDEYEIHLTVSRLPKELRQSTDLQELWAWLSERVSPTRVAILGLGGRYDHWTVAIDVTSQQIKLFDSGEVGILRRRSCTVGRASMRYRISPVHVFLIRRPSVERVTRGPP
jgi:hypothetical protein